MITIKHFMDKVEEADGNRIWVEPIGLTCDLKKWCHVNHTLCHVAPPRELWDWFLEHPDGYTYFRGRYHEWLNKSPYRPALQQLACAAMQEDITLLHQSEDNEHNSATALYEFLSELEAYCPPDSSPD
jgi:uncharacterized protein YeaO (DUF488 family)